MLIRPVQLFSMVRVVQRIFLWNGFLICLIEWSLGKLKSFPIVLSPHVRLDGIFECEWAPALNQGSPLSNPHFLCWESQWVSQLRAVTLVLMSAAWTVRRHMPQQLGGARLPPPPSRASWFLPALAALNSSTCDFLWFSPRHLEEEQFSCLGQGLATHTLT